VNGTVCTATGDGAPASAGTESIQPLQGEQGSTMLSKKSTTTVDSESDFESSYSRASSSRPATREVSHEQIARRAYEIFKSGTGGTPDENWLRAERELRARA
jgi:hypothetical protein